MLNWDDPFSAPIAGTAEAKKNKAKKKQQNNLLHQRLTISAKHPLRLRSSKCHYQTPNPSMLTTNA